MNEEKFNTEPEFELEHFAEEIFQLARTRGIEAMVLSFHATPREGVPQDKSGCTCAMGKSMEVLKLCFSVQKRLIPYHIEHLTPEETLEHGFILAKERGQG